MRETGAWWRESVSHRQMGRRQRPCVRPRNRGQKETVVDGYSEWGGGAEADGGRDKYRNREMRDRQVLFFI